MARGWEAGPLDRLGQVALIDGDLPAGNGEARRRTAQEWEAAAIEAHFRAHQWRKLALAYEAAARAESEATLQVRAARRWGPLPEETEGT